MGVLQLPNPSQVLLPPLCTPAVQDSGTLQDVVEVAIWQPPDPSHLPVSPHGGLAGQKVWFRGAPPAAVAVQVPGVAEQVWQPPLQAVLQQSPSTQNPLPQSVLAEQALPRLFMQFPLKQLYPTSQTAGFEEQVVAQLPATHK